MTYCCIIQFAQFLSHFIFPFYDNDRVINSIFSKIDDHIEKGAVLKNLHMAALPTLYGQFVKLIEYLVGGRLVSCIYSHFNHFTRVR